MRPKPGLAKTHK